VIQRDGVLSKGLGGLPLSFTLLTSLLLGEESNADSDDSYDSDEAQELSESGICDSKYQDHNDNECESQH
jgi:hypothetical protein